LNGELEQGDDEFEAQTLSAFGEAFNNIAIHGYRSGPPGDVDIEIESDEAGITICLMDTGASFDPNSVAIPDMSALPESGMGLFIMNSFMDEVDYRPGTPNVLRLAKRREPPEQPDGGGDGGGRGEPAGTEERAAAGAA
jgi:serine/threonine-protein kinase RsbW